VEADALSSCPAAQVVGRHLASPAWANVPGGQGRQALPPAGKYLPAGQAASVRERERDRQTDRERERERAREGR
jgi:hypothetical protein